jgi:hypothetical protein
MDVPIHAAAIRFRRLAGFADVRNLNLVAALLLALSLFRLLASSCWEPAGRVGALL